MEEKLHAQLKLHGMIFMYVKYEEYFTSVYLREQ
jgi:hypothetical protein